MRSLGGTNTIREVKLILDRGATGDNDVPVQRRLQDEADRRLRDATRGHAHARAQHLGLDSGMLGTTIVDAGANGETRLRVLHPRCLSGASGPRNQAT